jgi:hypothetical protein
MHHHVLTAQAQAVQLHYLVYLPGAAAHCLAAAAFCLVQLPAEGAQRDSLGLGQGCAAGMQLRVASDTPMHPHTRIC